MCCSEEDALSLRKGDKFCELAKVLPTVSLDQLKRPGTVKVDMDLESP